MSKEALLNEEPKKEEKAEVKDGKEEQKPLNDWRSSLTEDSLRKDDVLLKVESLDKLAMDYVRLKKMQELKADVNPVTDDSSEEELLKTAEAMLNVKEDNYSEDFEHKQLAYKYKLPSRLVEPFMKDLESASKKESKDSVKEKVAKNMEIIGQEIPAKVFDVRFDAGLKALDITKEEFKKMLPEEHRTNPELIKAITNLGKKQYSAGAKQILEEEKDSLPNDPEILKEQIIALSGQQMQARMNRESTLDLDKQINRVKHKYNKVTQQTGNTAYSI